MEISHTYTLTTAWLSELLEKHGGNFINENLFIIPKELGDGGFFFTEVLPGLSVVVLDLVLHEQITIRRRKSNNDLYIIHYDFSDEMNLIQINDMDHKIGYKDNLGLCVFDNAIENVFQPMVGERVFAIRLLVSRDLLCSSLIQQELKNSQKRRIPCDENTVFFYDYIDSKSKLIMHAIKNKSISEPTFDLYVKGVSQRLLAKFIDRYSNLASVLFHISEEETDLLNNTKEYLVSNLMQVFPGVNCLANMASMPVSEYKSLFSKMFVDKPGQFYKRKKMILAKELLQSKKFSSVDEVCLKLNYGDLQTFIKLYYKYYKKNPDKDFIKIDY